MQLFLISLSGGKPEILALWVDVTFPPLSNESDAAIPPLSVEKNLRFRHAGFPPPSVEENLTFRHYGSI